MASKPLLCAVTGALGQVRMQALVVCSDKRSDKRSDKSSWEVCMQDCVL